ncbi:MAG: hypothetical protein M1830_010127, partial [Pleopsidium flavum]
MDLLSVSPSMFKNLLSVSPSMVNFLSVSPSMVNHRGVSASIFAILQLSDKVIGHLGNLEGASKDCRGVIIEVIDEVSSISDLLKGCREQAPWGGPWSIEGGRLMMSEGPLEKYRAVLEHLASIIRSITGLKRRETLIRLSDKVEMEAIHSTVRQHKSSFRLALQNQTEEAMQWIWSQHKDNVELAKRVLAWVSCAQRRLTVLEIQHALAVVPGNTTNEKDALIGEELLLFVCAGLVGIDKASKELHFIHRTCQEYVERTVPDWFPTAQLEIGKACLTYLTSNVFLGEPHGSDQGMESQMQKYPFLRYAAQFWGVHVHGEPEMVLKELVLTFLEQESKSSFAMQLLQRQELQHEMHGQSSPEPVTRLWVAAYFGLEEICRPEPVTRLWVAAYFGLEEICRLLLANGDDLDAKTRSGETALYRAVLNRHEAVIRLLLEREADVNAQGGFYGNALQTASRHDHDAIVRLLIEKGADVDAVGGLYGNALLAASRHGHEAIVRVLIEKGADVNAVGGLYGNALLAASRHGHEAIVRVLIEKGADVNAGGGLYGNALQTASESGYVTIVRLLLENGASMDDAQKTITLLRLKGRNDSKRDFSGTIQLLLEHSKKHDVAIRSAETAKINIPEYRSSVADSKRDLDANKFVETYPDDEEAQAATHESRVTALTEISSALSPQILPNPPSPDHSAVISSQASEETESSRSNYSVPEFSTDMLSDDSDIESFADDEKRKRALTPGQDIDRMFRSPKRYFQELEEIRNEVYERSGLQLYDQPDGQSQPWQWDKTYRKWPWRVSSPADSSVLKSDLRGSDVHSFCDLAGAQTTSRRLFHLLECRNLLFKACENITTLKKGGFRQDRFSVLVVDQDRPNVARLVPLKFQRVEKLADDFKATLKEEFEARFTSNISQPDSASNLTQSCINTLNFLGLENSSNGGLWIPELLWRYAAQTLDLAIVSYAGAHLEPFDQLFIGRTLDQFTIQARYVGYSFLSFSLRRRSLRCLDGLLRHNEVWVFQCSNDLDKERLYLSTPADLLAEIWGPLWKSCPASRPEDISCYHVGNGSIIYWPADPSSTPSLHPGHEDRGPEFPCHWVPRDQDGTESFSAHPALSTTTFSGTETLLIGAEDIPEFRLNPKCHCETAQFERFLKETGCRRRNRTIRPTISVASDQISTQFGAGGYGFQVGHSRTFAHNRGITLKEAFIEVWELSPEDRNLEALLQSPFAAEVSICTKHTQRATLGELLSTPTMLNYMKGMRISKLDLRGKFLEALEKPDAMAALHQLYDENEDWQKIVGRAIFLCLKVLKHTGVDDDGNLLVLWIPRPGSEWLATLERAVHSWTPMLKDSIDCCTFAVLLDSCLELTGSLLDYGQHCLGPNHTAWDENKGPSVFKTKLCVNERLIPRGLKKKKTHRGPYPERWSISDIRGNCEFSLGKQGRLRVIKPLPYRRLLVKWDKNLLQVLTQDIVEPIRGLLGNAARNYHWENVEDEELDI